MRTGTGKTWPAGILCRRLFGAHRRLLALLFPAAILLVPGVSEANCTWSGLGGTNNWNLAANWGAGCSGTGGIPGAADVVTFNGTGLKSATISADPNVKGIIIASGYTGTITQAAGVPITIGTSGFVFSATTTTATFLGGDSDMTINGVFTLSATLGGFTATSGTTTITGAFTHTTAATFTANGGTVAFTGAAATINVNVTENFYNLTVNKNDGVNLTVSTGDTLAVAGTLTLTNGGIATGTINAQGAVIHGAGFDGGTGLLSITGAAARTINLTGDGKMPGVLLNAANVALNGPDSGTTIFAGTTTSFNLQAGTVTGGVFGAMTFNLAYTQSGGTFNAGTNAFPVFGGAVTASGGTMNGGSGNGILNFNAAATFSGATVNGQTSTWVFNGAFILSAGSFTASSGQTNFVGNFTHTAGGTFSHNNGTVVFSGASRTIDVTVNETFYDVWILKDNGLNLVVTGGDTLIVTGTLTLTDGQINTGTINAQGAVIHEATFDGGTGLLSITGTDPRTINLTGGGNMPGVLLNAANVTMNGPASGTTTFEGTTTSFKLQDGTVTGGDGGMTFNLKYDQIGGSFDGRAGFGTGTVTVTGAFTQSAGNFTGANSMNFGSTFGLSGTGTFTASDNSFPIFGGVVTASGGTLNGGGGSGILNFNAAATFSGATINGGTQTWAFNSTFTLSAGSFTASSGNTDFANTFTHTTATGTFSHNSGTVIFTGAAATVFVNVSETFYNLTVLKETGALTVANSDTLIVTGTLTLTDGVVNQITIPAVSAGGTIAAQGPITQATTFDGGTGLLVINGAGDQLFTGSGSTTLGTLPNVTVNKASGILTLASIVRTTNAFNVLVGTVYTGTSTLAGTGTFTLSSGATLGIGSTDGITSTPTLAGNIQNTGVTRSFDPGANYIYNGTAGQVTGNGLPATVNQLTINNSSGVTLSRVGTTSVTTALSLQDGVLSVGGNVVDIPATGSVSRTSGWVYATGAGGLQMWFPTGSNVSRTFPVGTAAAYDPVSVTFANVSSAGNLLVKTTAGDHGSIATSDLNPSKSVNCFWTLANGGTAMGFSTYGAVFNFNNPGDLDAGTNTSYLYAERFLGGIWLYLTMGALTSTSTEATGMTTLGDFQLAEKKENKLIFVQQPTDTAANATITPAVTVRIVGFNGELTSSTASVTVAIAPPNTPGGTLSGTKIRPAINGLATFNDLSIDRTGTYSLTATSGALTGATSNTFVITGGVVNYWVDNSTGSDGNTGSQGAPFASIEKAVSLIGSGGIVFVHVGVSQTGTPYLANNVIATASAGTAEQPTVIQGVVDLGELPLVVGANPAADVGFDVQANYVTVDGFEIQDTLAGVYVEASTIGVQISNNFITAPHMAYGIIFDHAQSSSVYQNIVQMVSGADSFFGIWDYSGTGNTIDSNKVTGFGTDGIASHYSTGLVIQRNIIKNTPVGIHVSHATGAVHLYNNTMDLSSWLGIYVEQSSATVTSRNNIVTNGLYGWGWDGVGTISSDYDDVYNNTHNYDYGVVVTHGSHMWPGADPNFVSNTTDPTKTTYYQLNSGSPCINAGIDVGLPFLGAAPDIGGAETQ